MKYAYWSREIAGWVIILIGLWVFWLTYDALSRKRIFEAAPMAFVGFVIFRGGLHLLKVAVAAQAARSMPEAARAPTRRHVRAAARSYGPTPVKSVVPGPKSRPATANGEAD